MAIWDYFRGVVSGVAVDTYDEQDAARKASGRASARIGEMLEDLDSAVAGGLTKTRHHSHTISDQVYVYDLGKWWAFLSYRNFPTETPVLVAVLEKAGPRKIQAAVAARLQLI